MVSEQSVFEKIHCHNDEFGVLLKNALKDGLSEVENRVSLKKYISNYYQWPELSYKTNSLPSLSSSVFSVEKKEYRNCFGRKEGDIIEADIESFAKLLEFVASNKSLESRLIPQQWKEVKDSNLRNTFIYMLIHDAIERYIHVNDSFVFDDKRACETILEIQNFVFLETLPIDIVVPVLFVNFDFDSYHLSEGIEVRRLTDEEHLARYNIKSTNVSVHEHVVSSATHAIVFKNWIVKNSESLLEFNLLSNMRAYPIDKINKFFASIRIVKDLNTGYAQVFSIAKGWSIHCKANLPNVIGTTTRSYPAYFEDYYWNIESVPLIGVSVMDEISKIFNTLHDSTENSIELSVKRLNQCLVRDSEEDSVLDATIALEALLSDDGNQEMTHKLALRVGALANLDKKFDKSAQQAFKDIKSIYSYRSAIVHGSKSVDKKRVIKLSESEERTTHSLAVEYVKFVLKMLIDNPKYRDPKVIDSELLLGNSSA